MQRMRGEEVAAQRRYHRVLALAEGKTATLLDHAALHPAAAAIRPERRSPQGLPDLPPKTRSLRCRTPHHPGLAKAAWNTGDAKDALALLQVLTAAWGHDAVPAAYELVARVLLQGHEPRRHGAACAGHTGIAPPGYRGGTGDAVVAAEPCAAGGGGG